MKFKHKLASIVLGLVVLVAPFIGAIAPALGSGTALAASYPMPLGDSSSQLVVYLSNTTGSQSDYKVTATRQSKLSNGYKNTFSFIYRSSGIPGDSHPLFIVDLTGQVTGCDGTNSTVVKQNTFDLSVTLNGQSVSPGEQYKYCYSSPGYVYRAPAISVTSSSTKTGTVSGTFTYTDSLTGETKSFIGSSTNATITQNFGSKTVTHLTVDSKGHFSKSGLIPGEYKLFATQTCNITGCVQPVYGPKTIEVKAGDNNLGTLNVADSVDKPVTDPTDDPTCESSAGALGWILCQLIDGMQNAIGGIYDHIIQPLLQTEPISTGNKTGNQIYKAWSNFRVYGDVFLVIALLIIVFGESIGGGLVDAYTAKKVLPRLLVAAVLINISYYLVAILVDITNIVGKGLMTLITTPFGLTGDFTLDINKTGATTMALLLTGAIVWAKVSVGSQFIAWLFFSVLLPLLLLFLSIMAVVLIRRALIVFLVIISPVAFALYCLPNTEKYFRKWWDILFETLLVYPIIASLFAMGKVSGYLINQSGGTNFAVDGLANILGIVALAVPLLLIPFSFKLAGGLMGRAYELASGARTKMNLGGATRERIKAQGARNRLQSRQKYYSRMQEEASKGGDTRAGRLRRATLGRAIRGAGGLMGYNIEAEASAARAEVGKTINDQIATGRDEEIRGLTVNKNTSRRRVTSDGTVQYESLGGQWINEADVDKGHARWGRDTFAQQAALSYEMRKAQSEGQLQSLARNYRSVAQGPGGWGMDDQQAGGAWIGAAFERQNEHLEFKSTDWETGNLKVDSNTGLAGGGLVDEVYEKKGSYSLAQMGSNTIEQLKQAHASADAVLASAPAGSAAAIKAQEQKDKIKAISETFMHETGTVVPGAAGAPPAAVLPPTPGSAGARRANTPGAASVAERVYELANLTGAYVAPPSNPTGPGSPQS